MIDTMHTIFPVAILATNAMSLSLSEEETEILKKLLSDRALPWQVVKRLEAIRLLAKGLSQTLVAKQLCVRREIIYAYRKTFLEGGFTALVKMEKPGKETLITEEIVQAVETYRNSQKKRPSNKKLSDWVFETYHITISAEWLGKRLSMREELRKSEPWR